jgi:hypothetical protein
MDGLDQEQRECLAAYWWYRAEGELTSWLGFQHALAERAVEDEYHHTLECRRWAMHFGHPGGEVALRGDRPISFRGASEVQNRLLRITLCGMSEAIGCIVLQHARPVITVPELREFNRRNMADEVQHGRVGWGHLATTSAEQRSFLRPWVPALLRLLHTSWCESHEEEREELVPFGYFSARLLKAAYNEAVHSLILPGFQHLGIARAA